VRRRYGERFLDEVRRHDAELGDRLRIGPVGLRLVPDEWAERPIAPPRARDYVRALIADVAARGERPQGGHEMKTLRVGHPRWPVMLLACILAAVAAPSGAATAATTGTATGKTISLGNGTYRISGAYRDPSSGASGTYAGTYVEDTIGYTSCSLTGTYEVYCDREWNPAAFRCNLIHGTVTFRSQGRMLRLLIGTEFPLGHFTSAVCLDDTDPQIHNVSIALFNGTPEAFSRGYGDLMYAYGSMFGTSTPRRNGVYEDRSSLMIDTCC
jgi:hypothetical protein